MDTYSIIRQYFNNFSKGERGQHIIKTGLTLEQAQEHCNDPETSSSTCTSEDGIKLTENVGPWFESYELDRRVSYTDLGYAIPEKKQLKGLLPRVALNIFNERNG